MVEFDFGDAVLGREGGGLLWIPGRDGLDHDFRMGLGRDDDARRRDVGGAEYAEAESPILPGSDGRVDGEAVAAQEAPDRSHCELWWDGRGLKQV